MSLENKYTVIDHNKMDIIQFNKVLSNSYILRDSLRQGNFVFDDFENLMFDLFLLLYKPVLFVENSANNANQMLQYSIIQAYLHSKNINKVRLKTSGSRSNTYMSLKWILDQIFERTRGTSWFADALKEAETADFSNMINLNQDDNFDGLNLEQPFNEDDFNSQNIDDILNQIKSNINKAMFSDKVYEYIEQIEEKRIAMQEEKSSNIETSSDIESSSNDKTSNQDSKNINSENNNSSISDKNDKEQNLSEQIPSPKNDENGIPIALPSQMSTEDKNELAFDMLSQALSDDISSYMDDEEKNPLAQAIEDALKNLMQNPENETEDKTSTLESLFDEINKQMEKISNENNLESSSDDLSSSDKDYKNLDTTSKNTPQDDEDLSISPQQGEDNAEKNPSEELIEGKLDSKGNEKSSTPPSDTSDNKNQPSKDDKTKNDVENDDKRKSTLKDEILDELNHAFENITKSENKDFADTSYSASDNIDSNEQVDASHIQSGQYTGNNHASSMEFRSTKKKWNPTTSPHESKYKDIIPSELKNRMDNFNIDNDLYNIESSIGEFEESINTLGIHKPSIDKLSLDDLLGLHKRFHAPLFLDFVNKVGRQKVCARRVLGKKKIKKRFHPRDTLTRSQDLDLLVDDEFINLSLDIPAFENDFYDRYLRHDLLTVEMTKEVGQYKGPIVLCYDGSGSMEGTKLEETQSHILSILEIARIQKRSLILIQFASASEPLFIKKINPKKIDVKDVLDILDTFLCGGTDFEKPLSVAIEYIKADKRNHSDILFITDGECEISQNFLERFIKVKEQRKFNLYTIMIHSYTYQDYGNIGLISDEVLEIGENNWKIDVDRHLFGML